MKKISLMEICAYLIGAFFVIAFWAGNAHSQSVPFNAYSVQTLGGNCTQQGSVMTQTANGRSICLGTGGNGQVLKSNGAGADVSWATVSGVGTVTSVGLTAPGQFSVANSPITAAGTLALSWQNQTANTVLAGPSSGAAAAPTFRALVGDDLPNPTSTKKGGVVSSTAPTNQFATGVNTSGVITYAQPAFSNLSGQASSAQIAAGAAVANLGYTPLNPANNLSDVASVSTARTNLAVPGLGTANSFTAINKWAKGADVASSTMLTLGNDGNYFDITGTTTITGIATKGVGTVVKLHFNSALILTHNATALILPNGANISVAAGSEAEFVEYSSGNWRLTNYQSSTVPTDPVAKLSSGSISNATTQSINLTSFLAAGYTKYKLYLTAISPASDGAYLVMDVSSNAGSSYYNSGYISPALSFITGTIAGYNSGSIAYFLLSDGTGNAVGEVANVVVDFEISANQIAVHAKGSHLTTAGQARGLVMEGWLPQSSINMVRFYQNTGNMSSGSWELYGEK